MFHSVLRRSRYPFDLIISVTPENSINPYGKISEVRFHGDTICSLTLPRSHESEVSSAFLIMFLAKKSAWAPSSTPSYLIDGVIRGSR
jgi:hypothetical protein